MIRKGADYIYDHGLDLPDIADFPDAGDVLFPHDSVDEEYFRSLIERAFNQKSSTDFNGAYEKMTSEICRAVEMDEREKNILGEQVRRVKAAVDLFFRSCQAQMDRADLPWTDFFDILDDEGAAGIKIGNPTKAYLRDLLAKPIDELKAIGDHDPKPHFYNRFYAYKGGDNPRLFDQVNTTFNTHGVFEAASRYNRTSRNLELDTIALHVATPTDTHHYQTLRDLPTTSKLISLHMDPKFNLMKAILYLDDEVGLEDGPFTTVPTSNRWYYDPIERHIASGNSTGNYLCSQAHRNVLLSFPKWARKNVILGRYILDGTKTSKMMLSKLKDWTTDEADLIVFDPTQTLHRGGLCKKGSRTCLQILMR